MMEPEYKNGSESLRGLETGQKEGSNIAHTTLEDDWEDLDDALGKDFINGTQYLEWLESQLPYLEEETEEDLDLSDEYIDDTIDREETVWEEGSKPEFKDGRQLVEWLERRLSYLEPFAPQDAVHYCFHREWSRDKFHPKLDLLVEDDMEENTEEEGFEEISEEKAREHTSKEETIEQNSKGESIDEEDIEEDNKEGCMGKTAEEKGMEEVAEGKDMEEAANEESIEGTVEEKGIEDDTQEEGMEEIAKEKGEKETTREDNKDELTKEKGLEGTAEEKGVEKNSKEEGKEGISRGAELTARNSHVKEENGDLIHPYIKLMTYPLILDGFLSKNKEANTFKISAESKQQRDETETMSNFWSADEKRKKSKICKLWSRLNPFNHKNKNETEKNHEKKERRAKKSILSRFFRRNRGGL